MSFFLSLLAFILVTAFTYGVITLLPPSTPQTHDDGHGGGHGAGHAHAADAHH